MSQTPAEAGGGGSPSHIPNKYFQQPVQTPVGSNFLSQGQGGTQFGGSFIPQFPVKSTNPHMGNGFRPHGPLQFNMHSSHINPMHQHIPVGMHQMNNMKGCNDNVAAMPQQYQQNHCGNVQYFPSGNYVTTVTVNPSEQHQQNHLPVVQPMQQQYMHNSPKYFMNGPSNTHMMQPANMKYRYIQNSSMIIQTGKDTHHTTNDNSIQPCEANSTRNFNTAVIPEPQISLRKECKTNKNISLSVSNSATNQNCKSSSNNSIETLCENTDGVASNVNSNNSALKNNSNPSNVNKNCSSISGSAVVSNRPRTTSRCDSVRSETGDSSCSSLSTDSTPEQAHNIHHPNAHSCDKSGSQHHLNFSPLQFPNNQMQHPMSNFKNNLSSGGSAKYQNYMGCQPRMNQMAGKPMQAFQHVNAVQQVQLQHGQVQFMQQQYQCLQGQGVGRQSMGMISNLPQGQQTNSVMVPAGTTGSSMQGHSMPNNGIVPNNSGNTPHNKNLTMPQNCVGPTGGPVPLQNFSASDTHGHYTPNQNLIPPQAKFSTTPGMQQPNMIVGMAGSTSGAANPMNKGFPVVVVPFGWKRIMHNGQIVYVSPSGSELRSPIEVCEYLTQENTCKCGLQCPLRVENVFCFDPKVPHRLTMPDELSSGEATKVCNHRRKLALAFSHHLQKQAKKEDGRKKRKRKAAEALESQTPSPTPTPTPSPAICQPPASQMVPFNSQSQPQTQTGGGVPTQMQYQMQHPMQQHHMYQHTPNQNWNGMYGVPRVMLPGGGMTGMCQGTTENYANAGMGHSCTPSPTTFGAQNCCENHHCMGGPQGVRPPFAGNINRAHLCRMPSDPMFRGMVPPQGGQHMQQMVQYNMMGGNRPPLQALNNNMCRMPMGVHPMPQMFGGMGMQGADPNVVQETSKMAQSEEGEKRRKTNNPRSRKKGKQAAERNFPCPNVDARSLRTENAVSPHTGPGPPFPTAFAQGPDPHAVCPSNGSGSAQSVSGLPVTGPSFMEDPNGYLAQQTALLNNTMAGGGVGQFSPQGARLSPRPSGPTIPSSQSSPLPPKISQAHTTRGSTIPRASPAIVPLPSNVPLPARVSKASTSSGISASNAVSGTLIVSSPSSTTCTSVHSKSSTSLPVSVESCPKQTNASDTGADQAKLGTCVATAESSFVKHTVTVTYTRSSVTTTTCRSESNSPHSSQDTDIASSDHTFRNRDSPLNNVHQSNKAVKTSLSFSSASNVVNVHSKNSVEALRKKSDIIVPDFMNSVTSCRSNSNTSSGSSLSAEAANKPLTPGPAESSMNTQSPLEMVQNIVSSIPLPASSDELTPMPGKMPHNLHQQSQMVPEQPQPPIHPSAVPHQQVIGSHVYNMAGGSNMTGVMYNTNGGTQGMLRGAGPLVVHGPGPQGSIPPGVIVTNSGSMVVVTSPFNSKGSVPPAPVVCSNVTGIAPMVGVQTVPQVQVQPQSTLTNVQSHQLHTQHLQQIQPVQPVVQFVNTFATMQTPVIIQNGSNLPVIGPASLIPSSTAAFVTSQPILAVDSTSHSSHLPMTHVVTSAASSEGSEDSIGNRLTPVATPASTPTTPGSSNGSETPPSGGSGSGGRKRKRKRNTSTPGQQQQQHNIMPAIIMGKPPQMVMNSSQIPQVAPYGGAHVATVTAMNANGAAGAAAGQVITAASQPSNPINVVQMVGGHVAGPLPVHVQQPHTILVPSAATSGLIINQLPDGTFVSTDHSSGVTYPVQLQLSGSHIVGVTPVPGSNPPSGGVVASIAPSLPSQAAMVAVRPAPPAQANPVMTTGAKIINISPTIPTSESEAVVSNVYGVNPAGTGQGCSLGRGTQVSGDSLQQPLLVGTGNATLLQRKTTTIVAQQTTVVATQGGLLMGTHSSVSTQTPGQIGESYVSSSDCVANRTPSRGEVPYTSPSHQSAEVTTTRQDEDYVSPPASLLVSPHGHASPESSSTVNTKRIGTNRQEPHSAMASEIMKKNENVVTVFWGFHRGHHYWPCLVLHQFGGEATVRWFGDGAVESVPFSSLSTFPSNARKISTRRSYRGRTALDEAIAEASEAVSGGCNLSAFQEGGNEAAACTSIAEDQTISPTATSIGTPSRSVSVKSKKRRKQRL